MSDFVFVSVCVFLSFPGMDTPGPRLMVGDDDDDNAEKDNKDNKDNDNKDKDYHRVNTRIAICIPKNRTKKKL